MKAIKLIALDLDGTLFNSKGEISAKTKEEIKRAESRGIQTVIATGRPFSGLPFTQIADIPIRYALTTNGAALYRIADKNCLYENCMDAAMILPILEFLLKHEMHIDVYMDGEAFLPVQCSKNIHRLDISDSLKAYMQETRKPVENLMDYVRDCGRKIQKVTLFFYPQPDGSFHYREETLQFLKSISAIEVVCGGFNNLEISKAGVSKGTGLSYLANLLGISMDETMAVGDSENDYSMINAAGIGVAMGNASEDIKEIADYITSSNEADGVSSAILHFIP